MRKYVRDLQVGDVFYPPIHPRPGTVVLLEKTVKTGAWYELLVRWSDSEDQMPWAVNPKPLGTHMVLMGIGRDASNAMSD